MPSLSDLIDQHLTYYKQNEKVDDDRARAYYRGDMWPTKEAATEDPRLSAMYAQKNLVNAITDTAISSLLGSNPQVAAVPQTEESQEFAGAATGLLSWAFRKTYMRRRSALALMDATLCKRGVFKVSWDAHSDCPVVSNPPPATVFFDLSARDPADIRYWLQACPLTPTAFANKVKAGKYTLTKKDDIKPVAMPAWMMDDSQKTAMTPFSAIDHRIIVYEFYDCESNQVIHYHKDSDQVLFKGVMDYQPFSMFSLSHSGIDCTGMSEVQLILDQQVNINQLLTLWKRITYLHVPKILYDAGKITSTELDKAIEAAVGAFVPVAANGTDELRNFAALFYAMPVPAVPEAVIQFIQRLESDVAFQSALAEAARGQVAGAKTATEMAIIDAQLRTRLATREGHLNTAIEDVALKMFYLMQRYMKRPKMVRIAGDTQFKTIGVQDIKQLVMDFEMVSYNPIRKNPAIMLETLQAMVPLLAQAPNVDMFKLFEALISGLGLPHNIIIPEAQARQAQAAAAQAQAAAAQQEALGGAAVKVDEKQEGGQPSDSVAVAEADGEAANLPPEALRAMQQLAVSQGQSPPQ